MAKDIISSYQSQNQGPKGAHVPDTRGFKMAMDAQTDYLNGLGNLAKSAGNFANQYLSIINERDTRDADTEISKIFRERRMEVVQTRKGKDADNLLNDEDEWSKNTMPEMIERTGLRSGIVKPIWEKHADRYLDKMGSYQVEQQTAYDTQSKLMAADEAANGLVNTRIGDLGALSEYNERVKGMFPNDPVMAEKLIDKGIQTAVKFWARSNPNATLSWFRQNTKEITDVFGKDVVKVQDMMEHAENKIRAEASHNEVLASRADRIQRREAEAQSKANLKNLMVKTLDGSAGPAELYAFADSPNSRPEDISVGLGFMKRVEDNDFKNASDLEESSFIKLASSGQLDEVQEARAYKLASQGKLRPEQLRSILATRDSYTKNVTALNKPYIKQATDFIENYYAPTNGLMGGSNPEQKAQSMQVLYAFHEYAKDKSPERLAKDFDPTNKDSMLRKTLEANKPIKANQVSSGPISLSFSPSIVSGATPSTSVLPVDKHRREGESWSDWKKRVSK